MSRVKGGVTTRRRKKKIFKLAKGNFLGRRTRWVMALETVHKGLMYAYRDRRVRKRLYRQMWTARLNAASRINGLSYSRLIDGLKKAKVTINRKMLSELAIQDAPTFSQIAEMAKKHLTVKA